MRHRAIILFFASCLRHGLIPNLLDGGRKPRFNCRDAAWWFLQAIKDYCELAPEGADFLNAPVKRKFPQDDISKHVETDDLQEQPLSEIIQEIMSKHVAGISYREWNAGPSIDGDMRDEGYSQLLGCT